MRDFLIEKLRGAEIALKASMTEATALKGQADADQEVCDRPAWGSALNRLRDLCCELIVPYSLSSSSLAFHPHLSSFLSQIINYLDLRSQELEGKNGDLSLKSEQLQAAYNLQCGSYSHRVRRYSLLCIVQQ